MVGLFQSAVGDLTKYLVDHLKVGRVKTLLIIILKDNKKILYGDFTHLPNGLLFQTNINSLKFYLFLRVYVAGAG